MSESSLFDDIMQGLNEAIAYERGTLQTETTRMTLRFADIPDWTPEEIKSLRLKCSMTQRTFAAFMGVSIKTIEAWESGRNRPSGSASRLMQLVSSGDQTLFNFSPSIP